MGCVAAASRVLIVVARAFLVEAAPGLANRSLSHLVRCRRCPFVDIVSRTRKGIACGCGAWRGTPAGAVGTVQASSESHLHVDAAGLVRDGRACHAIAAVSGEPDIFCDRHRNTSSYRGEVVGVQIWRRISGIQANCSGLHSVFVIAHGGRRYSSFRSASAGEICCCGRARRTAGFLWLKPFGMT